MYNESPHIEVQVHLHSIPMGDTAGKEVIVTFQGKIENNNIFYTDSNGLEM